MLTEPGKWIVVCRWPRPGHPRSPRSARHGVTLVVVLAAALALAALAGVALRDADSLVRLRAERQYEAALRELTLAIFRYLWLNGREPVRLEELVASQPRVLRRLPLDPWTGRRDSWRFRRDGPGIRLVTGSGQRARDGVRYADWWVDEEGCLHRPKETGEESQ